MWLFDFIWHMFRLKFCFLFFVFAVVNTNYSFYFKGVI